MKFSGTISADLSAVNLKNLTIELHDQNQKVKGTIARTATDKKGMFIFEQNPLTLKRRFQGNTPEVFLAIKKDDVVLYSTMDQMVLKLDKDIADVKINLPKEVAVSLVPQKKELPKLDIKNLLQMSGVKASALSATEAKLKQAGLGKLELLLSKPNLLTTGRTGLDKKTLARFKGLTRFAVASGSESLGRKLVEGNFITFSDIGAISRKGLLSRLGKLNQSEKKALNVLHAKAQAVRSHSLNQMTYDARRKARDGKWQDGDPKVADDGVANTCGCPPCENVFSPYSYMICLLDMIYYHWDLTTHALEQIVLQTIDDFDCEQGQECLLQIELAIEVLEEHGRIKLPISDAEFSKEVEKVWVKLLFGEVSKKK